jgi:hypothetical protein
MSQSPLIGAFFLTEWPDNLDEQTGWERVPTQVFDVIMKQEFEMLDRAELEAVNV